MKENERTKVESKRRNMKREEAKRTYSLDSTHGEAKRNSSLMAIHMYKHLLYTAWQNEQVVQPSKE